MEGDRAWCDFLSSCLNKTISVFTRENRWNPSRSTPAVKLIDYDEKGIVIEYEEEHTRAYIHRSAIISVSTEYWPVRADTPDTQGLLCSNCGTYGLKKVRSRSEGGVFLMQCCKCGYEMEA